jgi:hypothetical protein
MRAAFRQSSDVRFLYIHTQSVIDCFLAFVALTRALQNLFPIKHKEFFPFSPNTWAWADKVPLIGYVKKAMPITPYLAGQAFEPEIIREMSLALQSVCDTLKLRLADEPNTRLVASKIIELAQRGVRDAPTLSAMTLKGFRHYWIRQGVALPGHLFFQQVGQLGDIRRDSPRLVAVPLFDGFSVCDNFGRRRDPAQTARDQIRTYEAAVARYEKAVAQLERNRLERSRRTLGE